MKKKLALPVIKEYYIAFFDVLGYKDKMKELPHDDLLKDLYSSVINTINTIDDSNKILFRTKNELRVSIFSDNIAICMNTSDTGPVELLSFLEVIKEVQLHFLENGLLLRGGVTKGNLAINDLIIFGQALIDAVKLEQEEEFPRIVISDDVINDIYKPIEFYKKDKEELDVIESAINDKNDSMIDYLFKFFDNCFSKIDRKYFINHNQLELVHINLLHLYNEYKRTSLSEEIFKFFTYYKEQIYSVISSMLIDEQADRMSFLNEHLYNTIDNVEGCLLKSINYISLPQMKYNLSETVKSNITNLFSGNENIDVNKYLNNFENGGFREVFINRLRCLNRIIDDGFKKFFKEKLIETENKDEIIRIYRLQRKYTFLLNWYNSFIDRENLENMRMQYNFRLYKTNVLNKHLEEINLLYLE